MSQRSISKNLEPARPLKSNIKQTQQPQQQPLYYAPVHQEVNTIDDLISLTENVASALTSGNVTADLINNLSANLCVHGPQLEIISKESLDRAFIIFRNASQDDRLKITVRLTLLQLIELRANRWHISDGLNTYYKHRATNVEPENETNMLSTSPSAMTSQVVLGPGEIVRNSGKFAKPTKIPGKNYSKDEIVIRNADSGKVNPGAKERLVQITGPSEEKIIYAKNLIEDTIRRNASPVRLEASQEGSCSSLTSSVSDEIPRAAQRSGMGAVSMTQITGSGTVINQQFVPSHQLANHKLTRSNSHGVVSSGGNMLIHSMSTNDTSLGEYKYTVNIGPYSMKITGDCLDLVRAAKLVLDDYFSSKEFLESQDAAPLLDQSSVFCNHQTTIPSAHQLVTSSPFADSGVSLDMISLNHSSIATEDEDVFMSESIMSEQKMAASVSSTDSSSSTNTAIFNALNGLSRSRRSHFSNAINSSEFKSRSEEPRIVHEYESLLFYAKSPHSKVLPANWLYICEKMPSIVKQEPLTEESKFFDGEKFLDLKHKNQTVDDIIEISDDTPEEDE